MRCGICCWLNSTSEISTHVYSMSDTFKALAPNPSRPHKICYWYCTGGKCCNLAKRSWIIMTEFRLIISFYCGFIQNLAESVCAASPPPHTHPSPTTGYWLICLLLGWGKSNLVHRCLGLSWCVTNRWPSFQQTHLPINWRDPGHATCVRSNMLEDWFPTFLPGDTLEELQLAKLTRCKYLYGLIW